MMVTYLVLATQLPLQSIRAVRGTGIRILVSCRVVAVYTALKPDRKTPVCVLFKL